MRRVPSSEPNDWSRLLDARRAERAPLLDLIEQNPTRVGLVSVGTAEIAAFACRPRWRATTRMRAARRRRARRSPATTGSAVFRRRRRDRARVGTSEAYAHLFRVLCDPGDEVLAPAPGYPLLRAARGARGRAARPLPVELRRSLASRPRFARARDRAADARGDRDRAEPPDRLVARSRRSRGAGARLLASRSRHRLGRGVRRLPGPSPRIARPRAPWSAAPEPDREPRGPDLHALRPVSSCAACRR